MNPFFITGLPRSRTKWFSEYFDGIPGVRCLHQGINGCYSTKSLLNKMEKASKHNKYPCVGNSDSLLVLLNISEYATVIVDRDLDEVLHSLEQNTDLILDDAIINNYKKMNEMKKTMPGFHIAFDRVDNNLDAIHEYLIDIPFDPDYAITMVTKNITVNKSEKLSLITRYRLLDPQMAA